MTATAPAPPETDTKDPHRWMYWAIGGVLVVLVVIGLITWKTGKNDQEAQAKAQQLTASFRKAGLHVPVKQEQITSALGTDGGPVCDNPGNSLGKAVLFDQLANGASQVGRRPVIVDRRLILGEALILQTYCPDKLQKYKDEFNDLKFDNTIKG
jgi:hypothetical protein